MWNQQDDWSIPGPPAGEYNMTQTAAILEALKQGSRLTPMDALRRFGCFRLAARIWDLRKAGYAIHERSVEVGGAVVSEYSMGEQMELSL